jgi:hypothetical protein
MRKCCSKALGGNSKWKPIRGYFHQSNFHFQEIQGSNKNENPLWFYKKLPFQYARLFERSESTNELPFKLQSKEEETIKSFW